MKWCVPYATQVFFCLIWSDSCEIWAANLTNLYHAVPVGFTGESWWISTQERNFLLHTKQNGVFLSIKWIKIVWRRHWENLAMSQQLETPVKKKSFKLGLNSSWSPTLEETRVELHVVSNSWLKTFHTGIFWVVLLLCSLNVCKFFLQGVKSESNLHLPNLSSDFCCPKTVYC